MHRHGYKGRKFNREVDQRRALVKGLATSLFTYGYIETTIEKAKTIVPYAEVLITKAKRGDLHSRRQVMSGLSTLDAAQKLVDEIAPKLTARNSGHLRIVRTKLRVGDNAQMAKVSFVDDISSGKKAETATAAKAEIAKEITPKVKTEKVKTGAPKAVKAQDKHLSHKPVVSVRKSGER